LHRWQLARQTFAASKRKKNIITSISYFIYEQPNMMRK
jgi:hypothetical protein